MKVLLNWTPTKFLRRLESLRLQAGLAMGLGDVSDKVIPKPVLVSPAGGGTIQVRYFMPHNCHRVGDYRFDWLATACVTEGSVIAQLLGGVSEPRLKQVRIEHPSGAIDVVLSYTGAGVRQFVPRWCVHRAGCFQVMSTPQLPTTRRVIPLVIAVSASAQF
jgi:2-methylaconitate cis-trans-isomerase PrpF